jgi:hypothetical protein
MWRKAAHYATLGKLQHDFSNTLLELRSQPAATKGDY